MYSGSSGRAIRCNRRVSEMSESLSILPLCPLPCPSPFYSGHPPSPSPLHSSTSPSSTLKSRRNRSICGIQSRPIMRGIQPIRGGKPVIRRTRLIRRNRTIVRGKTRSIRKNRFIQSIRSIGKIARSNSTSRNRPRGFRNVRELTEMQGISAKKPPPLW